MTTWATAKKNIEEYLEAQFNGALYDSTRIKWPNSKFTTNDKKYVEVHFLWSEGSYKSAGTGRTGNRSEGILQLSIYDKPGRGEGAIMVVADVLAGLFSRKKLAGGVQFHVPSGPIPILTEEDDWYKLVVSCPFVILE